MGENKICGGYDAVFDPPLTEDFTCCICCLAFREPVQLQCGHQFCMSCLEKYRAINGVGFSCPIDRKMVDMNKIFHDKSMERMVLSLGVKCNNLKNSCDWKGELRALEKHIENCPFGSVKCTNEGCLMSFLKMYLADHLSNKCKFRYMTCNFCRESYVFKDEEEHTACCRCYPIECINFCGESNIPRQEMDTHLKLCRLSIHPCNYVSFGCPFKGTINQREIHDKADVQNHLKIAVHKVNILEKETSGTKKTLALTKEKHRNLEKRLEMHEKQTMDMMRSFEDRLKKLDIRLKCREATPIEKAYNEVNELKYGVFLWTIDDYQNKLEAAKTSYIRLCSELFLSSPHGYTFRCVAYINGEFSGQFSLSLYVQLARGPNDNSLKWPFPHKICVSLLHHQDETKHVAKILDPNQFSRDFNKPTSDYNNRRGWDNYIPLEDIRNNGYVCDNRINVMYKILD